MNNVISTSKCTCKLCGKEIETHTAILYFRGIHEFAEHLKKEHNVDVKQDSSVDMFFNVVAM